MLAAAHLRKAYGERPVLDQFHLTVKKGQIVSVMGPSGSGKSTLLYCLGGLMRPDAGGVHIHGMDIASLKEPALTRFRRRYVGYVFQWHGLLPDMTACENVALASWANGNRKALALRKARGLLADLGLDAVRDAPAQQLSGGEAQRVAVARALVNEPAVLLADEPTAALNREFKYAVVELIQKAAAAGCAVVMATHDPEVARAADRVVHIG